MKWMYNKNDGKDAMDIQSYHLLHSTQINQRPQDEHTFLLGLALQLFNRARINSYLARIRGYLFQRQVALLDLQAVTADLVQSRNFGGIRPVNIHQIRGTMGRESEFDCEFNPLTDRIRDRWVGIAVARYRNIPLAPVELVQIGECYFVIDGHHRISVARALGERAIDAEIVVCHFAGNLQSEQLEFIPYLLKAA
jgi:hypothetical protein